MALCEASCQETVINKLELVLVLVLVLVPVETQEIKTLLDGARRFALPASAACA